MPGRIRRATREQESRRGADEPHRRVEHHGADRVQVRLAARGAVRAVDAMAQLAVPGALGGVQALQPVRPGLLAAQVVAQALALAYDRAVPRDRDVPQLRGRLALPALAPARALARRRRRARSARRQPTSAATQARARRRRGWRSRARARRRRRRRPGGEDVGGDRGCGQAATIQPARLAGAGASGCMGRRD